MKNSIYTSTTKKLALLLIALVSVFTYSQKKPKVHYFEVERTIEAPASEVWKVVGEDFGAIANSHPKIVSSSYNQGSITYGGEGAERICNLNEDGTKYLKEKQIDYDPDNYSFTVQIFNTIGVPIDSEHSTTIYKVVPIDETKSKLVLKTTYKTKPAFLGGIVKGKFKKQIVDYLIAVEHHTLTGENVNKDNFKRIKKAILAK